MQNYLSDVPIPYTLIEMVVLAWWNAVIIEFTELKIENFECYSTQSQAMR